jgi:hypothetical protein
LHCWPLRRGKNLFQNKTPKPSIEKEHGDLLTLKETIRNKKENNDPSYRREIKNRVREVKIIPVGGGGGLVLTVV